MQTVLISIHLIVVLGLIVVVLLQRSEGGLGLGGGGSGGVSGFMTGRGQANALTRATAVLAAMFFATSMTLAVMSHRAAAPRSIIEGAGTANQPAAQPNADNLLDTLRQGQGTPPVPVPAAPAQPTAPVPVPPSTQPSTPDAPQSR